MTQYQIPEHIRESMTADELKVARALQQNIDDLRELKRVLEGIREEGFKPYSSIYVVRGPSA